MFNKLASFAVLAILVLSQCLWHVQFAKASTYTYTGNDFTTYYDAPYTSSDSISGSFTTNAPIPANFDGQVSDVTSVSFSDGLNSYTNPGLVFFDIKTDSAGHFVQWTITGYATAISSSSPDFYSCKLSGTLCAGNFAYDIAAEIAYDPIYDSHYIASGEIDNQPGTWSSAGATPLPPASGLFATSLIGLGVLVWRSKKKSAHVGT